MSGVAHGGEDVEASQNPRDALRLQKPLQTPGFRDEVGAFRV